MHKFSTLIAAALTLQANAHAFTSECHNNDPTLTGVQNFSKASLAIGTQAHFQNLLEKYYRISECGERLSPAQAAAPDILARKGAIESELEHYNWDPINLPEAMIEFMLAKKISGENPSTSCIPPVGKLGQSWLFAGVLGAKTRWIKSKILPHDKLQYVIDAMITNLVFEITQKAPIAAGVAESVKDTLHEVYKDYDVFTDEAGASHFSTALQQGCMLGDKRAYEKAKSMIKAYYSAPLYRSADDESLAKAVYAVKLFESKDDAKVREEKKELTDFVMTHEKTPRALFNKLKANR